jgi:hypothetical protein
MSIAANDQLASEIQTEGFAVVRNFFSEDEIAKLRDAVAHHFRNSGLSNVLGYVQPNAAIEVDGLDWLYVSEKVIGLFRQAFATDNIVFTGHCDIHRDIRSGWHKDSGEKRGDYFHGDYFGADDCKVYKMAVYLEDHTVRASGLSVFPRSHRGAKGGEPIHLDTVAGDVILFDVRLTHRGQDGNSFEKLLERVDRRMRRIISLKQKRNPPVSRLHSTYLRLTGRPNRFSVFFTFGSDNHFTEDFAQGNMNRQLAQTGKTFRNLPAALRNRFGKMGVNVAKVFAS